MKKIRCIRTVIIGSIFLSLFFITSSVIALGLYIPSGKANNKIVQYFLKNISIQATISDDFWMAKYPYEYSWGERYQMKVQEIEKAVESLCTISFPESDSVDNYCKFLKEKIYGFNIDKIIDKSGNIHYVQKYIENVKEFSQTLETEGYPFLYVRTPLPSSLSYHKGTNSSEKGRLYPERAATLTDALAQSGIDVIDFAKDTEHAYSFDKSSHWFPKDALYAAGVIADQLNTFYGFSYDPNCFQEANYQSFLSEYPDVVEEINRIHGYSFDIPVPIEETEFTVLYAEEEKWSGSFTESLLRPKEEWHTENGAYHHMFRISNTLIHEIYNDMVKTNADKHILMISDSFDWPLGSYLAMGTGKITLLHNASFTGSILSYIRATKPDLVLIAYNDTEYDDIYTKDAFNLK